MRLSASLSNSNHIFDIIERWQTLVCHLFYKSEFANGYRVLLAIKSIGRPSIGYPLKCVPLFIVIVVIEKTQR